MNRSDTALAKKRRTARTARETNLGRLFNHGSDTTLFMATKEYFVRSSGVWIVGTRSGIETRLTGDVQTPCAEVRIPVGEARWRDGKPRHNSPAGRIVELKDGTDAAVWCVFKPRYGENYAEVTSAKKEDRSLDLVRVVPLLHIMKLKST